MTYAVFALARPTFDVPYAESLAASAFDDLSARDLPLVGSAALIMDQDSLDQALLDVSDHMDAITGVILLQASFCDAGMAVQIAEAFDVPMLIWAFPEPRLGGRLRLNSFCGLNLASHALGRRHIRINWLYQAPDAEADAIDIEALFRNIPDAPSAVDAPDPAPDQARTVMERLNGESIGLIGDHPDGFDTCRFDEADVKSRFGVSVDRMPVTQLFDGAKAVSADRVSLLHAETAERLDGLESMDREPLEKSLRCYAALRSMADDRNLAGFAVRCWPETFTEYGCAVCGAMARLNGERLPASCEADLLGTLGSLMLQELSGHESLLVDIVDMDHVSDTSVVWHCGLAPLSMCSPDVRPEAALHSNRVKPLLHQFPLKPGRVTVMRLSQSMNGFTMVIGCGDMQDASMSFTGTSGVLKLDGGTEQARKVLINGALEHHLSLTYGDCTDGLMSIAQKLGISILPLSSLQRLQ